MQKLNAFIKIFRSFESSIHDEFKDINIPRITYHMTVNNRSETSRNMEDHFRGISDSFECDINGRESKYMDLRTMKNQNLKKNGNGNVVKDS